MRRIGKSLLSLTLAFSMVFSALMLPDIMHINDTKEASAATVSSVMGTDGYSTKFTGTTLTAGKTYTFGGYDWVCAETNGNLAVLQSTGVTDGGWPGYAMSGTLTNAAGSTITLTEKNLYYGHDIDGYDISNYNDTTQSLYNSIKAAEYTSATYGKGLYLVSCNVVSNGSSNYWKALKTAAANWSSFGALNFASWTGTSCGNYDTYYVYQDGSVTTASQHNNSFVVAPAFNLDTSKVRLSGTTIEMFQDSTGINATQSITSVKEGATTDLASIITAVKYVGGDNAGKSASYTVSCDRGSINGTTYTAPNDVKSSSEKVNFTITSTRNTSWKTTVSCNLTPQAAGKIEVTKKGNYPDSITTGDQIDFADYITVTAKDAAGNVDGEITTYDVICEGLSGSGHVMTANTVTDDTTYPITITAHQTIGTTSYDGKVYGDAEDETTYGKVQIKIKPSTSGYTDRDGLEDSKGFHKYEDLSTGITWNYKYDDSGNIRFLYTTDNVEKIISKGKVLLVPSSINGTAVIGIGGGRKNEDTIPFIPTSGEKANNTWTSIYIPSSIKYINDEAFINNQAAASVVIPSTVEQIGVGAFKDSKITSLVINSGSKNNVELYESAFENCDALKDVAIRGDHTIIGRYAFKNDTAIKSLDIPYGTRFGKTSQDDSYAFAGTTGLEVVKIDTDTVYRNIFSGNKSLKKVIFGENVTTVNYDWSGTAATEGNQATLDSTVDRTTYVLNADTVFKMAKTTGGSPFGYKGNLTVVGKKHSLDGWENKYNDKNDPVIAKTAYLASEYDGNSTLEQYAKGTADSITITVEEDPSTNSGVTETIASEQTGIEASCSSVLLTTKTLNKDKITVYKMFGMTQNGKCENDEFYVFRTSVANELLNKTRGNQRQEDGTDNWYATDSNEIKQEFMNADTVTAAEEDLESGTLDLTVVMLKCDANGNIYVNHNTANNVQAFTYALAVPVKAYTAEDDFLENYGSYEAVITTIDGLKANINNLKSQIALKDEEIAELNNTIEDKDTEIADKNSQITAKDEELAELKATLAKYTDMYNKLVTQMEQLNESMGVKDDGYFADKKTDNGTVKVVYINGKELTYTETPETEDGHKLYESTGDIDDDGIEEKITYWVDENGIHVVKKNDVTLDEELVYSDNIAALQRRITAQLISLQSDLKDANDLLTKIDAKIAQLKTELGITDSDFDDKSQDAQLEEIYNRVVSINTKLSSYDSVIKSIYKQLLSEELSDEQLTDINNVLTKMTEKITALKAENKNLSDTVIEKEAKITELNGKLTESQNTVKGLTAEIEKMKTEAASMQTKIDEQAKTLEDTKKQVDSLTASNTSLNNEITSLTSNVATLEANNQRQEEQINTLNTTLSSKDEQIANKTATIEELQGVIEQAKKDAAALKETNKEQASTIEALNTNVTNLTNIKDEQATQIAGLQENVTTLTSQNTALAENVKTLTATIEEQESKIAELKEQLAAQKTLVEQLQEEASGYLLTTSEAMDMFGFDSKMSKDEMKAAIGSFVAAKTTLGKIQSAFNTDKDGDELVAFLQTNAGNGSGNAPVPTPTPSESASADYNNGYKAGYAAGKKDGTTTIVSSSGSSSSEVTTLNKQVDTLQAENKDLTTQVNTLSTGIDELYNAIPSSGLLGASPIDDTVKKLSAVKVTLSSMESLNKQNTKLTKKVASLDETNKELTKSNKSLKKTNKELTNSNNSLKKTNSSLKSENATLTATNKSLESTNSTLRSELQDATSNTASVSNNSNTTKGSAIVDKKEENVAVKPTETETETETESTESTEATEENVPTLSDKVSGTKPIYETPEIEQDTESGNDEVSGLPSVPGDTECAEEPLPIELNDSDSSLPIGPIVFVVIVVVGVVVVILKRNKKAKADIDGI